MSTPERVIVYCPNGCTTASMPKDTPFRECPDCGCIMRTDHEDSIFDSVVSTVAEDLLDGSENQEEERC